MDQYLVGEAVLNLYKEQLSTKLKHTPHFICVVVPRGKLQSRENDSRCNWTCISFLALQKHFDTHKEVAY